jgi:hypothetical protein
VMVSSPGPYRPAGLHGDSSHETGSRCDGHELVRPAATLESHLLDTELDGRLTVVQSNHLATCGLCQERYANVSQHPDLIDEDAFLTIARSRIAAGVSTMLETQTKLQSTLHELTLGRTTRDDVRTGQIWRLRWEGSFELAIVLNVDRWCVTVAPVTIDTDAADEYSFLLAPYATSLNIPLAACISLECIVPLFTFDRLVAQAGQSSKASAPEMPSARVVQAIRRAWRRGDPPPADVRYGEPLLDGDLDRRELRNTISAAFKSLVSAAPVVLSGTPQPSTGSLEMIEDLTPDLLAELIVQVSRPRWRSDLRRFAQSSQITEDEARWQLAEMAAARLRKVPRDVQDTADSSTTWEPIVQMCLQAAIRNRPSPR